MALQLVATCALGLEEFVESELSTLGAQQVSRSRGAVSFRGTWSDALRANWRLRTANRVLVELARWDGSSGEALAAGAERLLEGGLEWDGVSVGQLLHPSHSFAIHATSSASRIRDTRWVGLKVKDGIVDAQRRRFGRRASIDRKHPVLHLRVWLSRDHATLLLDTSGEPLDRRGYRFATGTAPVREHLAATCVMASGWDGQGPVVDPMCGTGTLLAEAAVYALGLAPGRLRRGWAFERLPGFEPREWTAIRQEPIPAPGPEVSCFGVDVSADAIGAAQTNLRRAGLSSRVTLQQGDGFAFRPPQGPGLLLVNPAYGMRLAENREQWPRLGDLLKRRYTGWRAVVLAGGEGLGKHIGLRPERRIPVRNGPLAARILVFDLY